MVSVMLSMAILLKRVHCALLAARAVTVLPRTV
jgi:hypothetical protein